jgi:steroid delta-isomerase-like uncharacterized protein
MDIETQRRHFVAAYQTQDAAALARFYSVDAVRRSPGDAEQLGVDEILSAHSESFSTFSEQRLADAMLFLNDQLTTVIWGWHGTQRGSFCGVPASGAKVGVTGASMLWWSPEGRIVRQLDYWDPYAVLKQLGAAKEPGRPLPALRAEPEVMRATHSAREAENLRHVRAYHQHLLRGELEPWLAYMTDDIAWDDQMAPGLALGKEHSASDFHMLQQAFRDPKIHAHHVLANGDFVIHQGVFSAQHVGPLKELPATRRYVQIDNLDVISFRDGLIDRGWTFGNSLDIGAQLGVGQADASQG